MSERPTALGDGVFARFDGRSIWLTTKSYNVIELDPDVCAALLRFMTTARPQMEAASDARQDVPRR